MGGGGCLGSLVGDSFELVGCYPCRNLGHHLFWSFAWTIENPSYLPWFLFLFQFKILSYIVFCTYKLFMGFDLSQHRQKNRPTCLEFDFFFFFLWPILPNFLLLIALYYKVLEAFWFHFWTAKFCQTFELENTNKRQMIEWVVFGLNIWPSWRSTYIVLKFTCFTYRGWGVWLRRHIC